MEISRLGAQAYTNLSSGLRINSAADDAAGLGISEGMTSQINGYEQNVENIGSMNDLTKTAEGALGSIQDSLGRIRELAVQASNGILTEDDRSVIQDEIGQLMEGITETARNTEFNTIRVLDGSFSDMNTAMNPDGSGRSINIESAALDELGIEGFDVTDGSFDISDIDAAIERVSESRSNLGSISNAFEYATNNINNNISNLSTGRSRIMDADMAEEITNLRREEVLQQYQIFAQQREMEQERTELGAMQNFRV